MSRALLVVAGVAAAVVIVIFLTRRQAAQEPEPLRQETPAGKHAESPAEKPAEVATPAAPEVESADPADRFWALIARAVPDGGVATEAHAEAVTEALKKLPAGDIVAFDRFIQDRLDRAYRWDLWAVAYIAMGGCGDDGFEYFRLWLIAQGKDYYESALRDPAHAVDALEPGEEAECELLLYAASDAHESVAGKPLPPSGGDRPKEPAGEGWDEKDVARLYPAIAKRFGYGK